MSDHDVWDEGYRAGFRLASFGVEPYDITGNPYDVLPPAPRAGATHHSLRHGERAISDAGETYWWDASTRQWLPLDDPKPKPTELT